MLTCTNEILQVRDVRAEWKALLAQEASSQGISLSEYVRKLLGHEAKRLENRARFRTAAAAANVHLPDLHREALELLHDVRDGR